MAGLNVKQIRDIARQLVKENPGGIRFADLVRAIAQEHPETPNSRIRNSVWNLDSKFPNEITKADRGVFKPFSDGPEPPIVLPPTIREEDFYPPFAEWLKDDLDEVTAVAPLGGAGLKGKWGTPDVVGAYKPLASNLVKFPLEIVSAEIKIDAAASVTAFGQAVAYRLFSAKSYVVMPGTMSPEDLSRLEALSMLFGIGLVVFDVDVEAPNFTIRVRAQRFSPDMFYVNEFADRLRRHNRPVFEALFG